MSQLPAITGNLLILCFAILTNITLLMTYTTLYSRSQLLQRPVTKLVESNKSPTFDEYLRKVEEVKSQTKIIYFVNNDNKTIGNRGITYNEEYFKQRCGGLSCLVTTDKNYLGPGKIDDFDALIFKIRFFKADDKARSAVPEKRKPHQRYILNTHESSRAENVPRFVNEKYLSKSFYNWTWTYRKDSDILESYGPFLGRLNEPPPIHSYRKKESPKGLLQSTSLKTKMAFWTVSHCKTDNFREKYVEALRKYVDVDIYGACSGLDCPRKQQESCFASLGPQYWFYLAFENSNCPDYITEKLWRILDTNIVPVVMGGGNYSRDAPEKSVIDVNDFGSVQELAKYLTYLTEHPEEYLKYFEWKKDYVFYYTDPYCVLCEKLHDPYEPSKTYPDMTKWFYYDSQDNLLCTDGSERKYFQSVFDSNQIR